MTSPICIPATCASPVGVASRYGAVLAVGQSFSAPNATQACSLDTQRRPDPNPGAADEDAFFPSTSWRMPESMPEATRTPVFESGGGGDFGGGGAESSWEPESTKVVESAPAEVETCSRSSYTSESSYSSSDSSSSDSGSSSSSSD